MKEIRDAFARDGVEINYSAFRREVARVTRERATQGRLASPATPKPAENEERRADAVPATLSVVAGMIEQEQRRKRLEFEHQKLPNEEDLF